MRRIFILFSLALAGHLYGDWLFDSTAKTLTECDSEGVAIADNPWVFSVTSSKVVDGVYNLTIKYKTIGAADKLDLQTPIHGQSAVITSLADDFLKHNTSKALLTSIKLPLTLTSIGKEAFANHSKLVHVEPFLPDSIQKIGNDAFYYTAITNNLRIGHDGNPVTVGTSAFSRCLASSADLGSGVTALSFDMFKGCSSLSSVKLSDAVTSIGEQTFESCTALTTIEPLLPDSVTAIGSRAFYGVPLKANCLSIKAQNKPISILSSTFYISGITNIVFGDGQVTLSSDSFMNASNVKTVRFGKGVLKLPSEGMKAFRLSSYNARFDVPAGIDDWEEFIAANKTRDWADVPETGNNPSKEKYRAAFPGDPDPRCLIYLPGSSSNNRYIWVKSYQLGDADDKVLYIIGKDTEGNTINVGEVYPEYGTYVDAGDKAPISCTAPEFVNNGWHTEYKCVGYQIEKMDENGGLVLDSIVKDGSSSYTFNPTEAGSTRLVWLWEPYAYDVDLQMPTLLDLGTVSEPTHTHNEFYLKDSVVKFIATAKEGAKFVRWFGDVPEDQAYNAELNLKIDAEKTIYPYFEHDWVVDGNYITDGYWRLAWSGKINSMSIGKPNVNWAPGFLDLRKPVIGGIIDAMGADCFKQYAGIVDIRLPDSLTAINKQAFVSCTKLKNVSPFLPSKVISVAASAFSSCSAITNALVIGNDDGTFSLGGTAFGSGCANIPSITLGKNVKTLSQDAFKNSTKVTEIRFLGDRPTFNTQSFQRTSSYSLTIRVYLPAKLPGWSSFLATAGTPWQEVPEASKQTYFKNFGEDAPLPTGMITESNSSMGQMRNQWYFDTSPSKGTLLIIR